MKLNSCIKRYKKDTHRVISPRETLTNIEPKSKIAGITDVVEITNLDRIGIPVFSSVRLDAERGSISAYNGKGTTPVEAKVSTIMEGIERYSAEIQNRPTIIKSYSSLLKSENALDPKELILPRHYTSVENIPIPWVKGYDLMKKEEIFVPANAVFHPLPSRYNRLFRTNTNGLASGNKIEEAIFHGLAEAIERDAWSLVEMTRDTGPNILIEKGNSFDLLNKFSSANVSVYIKDITSDVGIPTFAAASEDVLSKDPTLLVIGMGSHTNVDVALIRALTEVAQSRLTQIHGLKVDMRDTLFKKRTGYEGIRNMNDYWFDASESRKLNETRSLDYDDFMDDINYTIERLKSVGLNHVIVVDLTKGEIGIPVVKVIVPGLEVYAMDPERLGQRCINFKNKHIHKT